jgi:hypothetical protein
MQSMMLVMLLMNTNRKRGPKPSGVEKKVFYARVEPVYYERLERYLAEGCPLFSGHVRGTGFKQESVLWGRPEPEVKPLSIAKSAYEGGKAAVEEAIMRDESNQVKVLLEDIQRLTDQLASLEQELEECRNLNYDEKMAYWKARALKAEAYAASKNE